MMIALSTKRSNSIIIDMNIKMIDPLRLIHKVVILPEES